MAGQRRRMQSNCFTQNQEIELIIFSQGRIEIFNLSVFVVCKVKL